MFRHKICGITRVEDAVMCRGLGADAIGLNFVSTSPRYVAPEVARRIADDVGETMAVVGVFVNERIDRIRTLAADLRLDFVQLHGDEPAETIRQLAPTRVIRALRCKTNGLDLVRESCEMLTGDLEPAGLLVDAYDPQLYGGSGRTLNWEELSVCRAEIRFPLILAGGLTPENVAYAIRTVRPNAVDVASGVESTPGVKDADLVRQFIRNAEAARS